MPITKSAIKSVRQSEKRRKLRLPYRTKLKTMSRKFMDLVKEGTKSDALAILPDSPETTQLRDLALSLVKREK